MIGTSHRERGAAVSTWAVLIVAATTLILGVAVDLSGQIAAKRQAGDVAAQAARVAGQQLDAVAYLTDGRTSELATTRARAAAVAYITRAGMTGTVTVDTPTTLVVTTIAGYTPVFLSAFGVGRLEVTGTARTEMVRAANGRER